MTMPPRTQHPYREPAPPPRDPAPPKPRVPWLCRLGIHVWQPQLYRAPSSPDDLYEPGFILVAGIAYCARCPKERLIDVVRVQLPTARWVSSAGPPDDDERRHLADLDALTKPTAIEVEELRRLLGVR